MLRKMIEAKLGPMNEIECLQAFDLATSDIRVNRVMLKQKTSLRYITNIVEISLGIIRRKEMKQI